MTAERVELVQRHPAEWTQRFQRLFAELRGLLGTGVSIEHIGSTAVPDLPSKDVVDVLVGAAPSQVPCVRNSLVEGGFILDGQLDGHAWLTRREHGHRTCVIHVVEIDSERWVRRIAFRDLLRTDADARAEYLQTKRVAAAQTSNWDDYTQAKTATVHRLLLPHLAEPCPTSSSIPSMTELRRSSEGHRKW